LDTNADRFWMSRALDLARRAGALGEVPVGAVLVRDGQALAEGANAVIGSADPTAHAELVALRAGAAHLGNYRLPRTTLYVTIEPCTMCAGALVHARVARLVFGAREPRSGAVESTARVLENPGLNHRVEVRGGVLAPECGELIGDFFRRRRLSRAGAPELPATGEAPC
jgi:tRNA(adenine34) deaminase